MTNARFLRVLIADWVRNEKNKNIFEKVLDFFRIYVHSIRAF